MTFFFNLLYSVCISYLLGITYSKYKLKNTILFIQIFICIGFIWIIICGGQFCVGTDYNSYMDLFNGYKIEYFADKKHEYLFYYIVVICNNIGIKGQSLFYIFYFINFIFLFLFIKRLNLKYIFLFILLYITYSNMFNNQLNMVRQGTAIHLCTYAGILYSEGKYKKTLFWIVVSTFLHLASLFALSLFTFKYLKRLSPFHLKIILISSAVGMFFMSSGVFSIISNFLPIQYQLHLERDATDSGIMGVITKLIFIPLFWMSSFLNIKNLTKEYNTLFYIGFLGFCIKLLLLKLPVVNRLADFFILFSIFPIYLLLVDLYRNNKKFLFFTICICLLLFYGMKTILFPTREYLYNSIYF